jgi:nitrous oxidase accessory protein NosD
MDQGSSAMIVRNNRIHDIAKSPIRFHKAKENTIQDNTLGIERGENAFTFNATDSKIITFKDNRTLQNKELEE